MKSKRAQLRLKLDKLVKQIVKERDNFTCQYCGKKVEGSNCHASHVIPVSAGLRLAYDTINLKVLCYHDHLNWWHRNPLQATKWFQARFPERYEYLMTVQHDTAPIKDFELEELYEKLVKEKETLVRASSSDLPF
jgi:hypothetical protein